MESDLVFQQWGNEALVAHAKDKLVDWEDTVVHIAVLGPVGAGKASFINMLRGIEDPEHPLSAAVGEEAVEGSNQMPSEMACYRFPESPEINVWKLPAVVEESLLPKMVAEKYGKRMEFEKFDAFILLTSYKFTKVDKEITEVIKRLGKPYYLARTKTEDILSKQQQGELNFDTMSKTIRLECLDKLWLPLPLTQTIGIPHVYLITTKQIHEFFHNNENESLNQHIVDCVPENQRTAIGKMYVFH
jgi:GTP-binding protein EngB required for normal cell division